jgi:hypothetical protein
MLTLCALILDTRLDRRSGRSVLDHAASMGKADVVPLENMTAVLDHSVNDGALPDGAFCSRPRSERTSFWSVKPRRRRMRADRACPTVRILTLPKIRP